jgi:hypothetical protein
MPFLLDLLGSGLDPALRRKRDQGARLRAHSVAQFSLDWFFNVLDQRSGRTAGK